MQAGFGLGRLHHLFFQRERSRVVLGAIDAGFRHFDLAPVYGDGLAERELGRILGKRRAQVSITTKFGIPFRAVGELPMPVYFAVRTAGKLLRTSFGADYSRRDFTPKTLVSSLEASLRRLRTDYVDYLLIHEPLTLDEYRAMGDVWAEMERQQRLGKVRKFGVSGDARMLLDAEKENLVPDAAVRMVPMNDVSCGLPDTWFQGREVFVFNIVRHLRRSLGPDRIETRALLDGFYKALPTCRPILATHNLDEIKRMGEVIASLDTRSGPAGATR